MDKLTSHSRTNKRHAILHEAWGTLARSTESSRSSRSTRSKRASDDIRVLPAGSEIARLDTGEIGRQVRQSASGVGPGLALRSCSRVCFGLGHLLLSLRSQF